MGFICKELIFLSSILVLLSFTIYSAAEFENKNIKSATFVSEKFEVGPGKVAAKTLFNVEFPQGHVGIKSFDAELVDEKGNSVPLYEAYLHHWFAIKYHAKDWNMLKITPKDPMEGAIYIRNEGTCNSYILPHYWGMGAESRGTKSQLPDPYAVEHGNPSLIPAGYQEKWLLNLMVIDTRGTKDKEYCTECRCSSYNNLQNNFYNVTLGIDGKPLGSNYKGGIFCCQDNFQCELIKGFEAPTRKLALRYKITWVDWNQQQIPIKVYILDATDRVKNNGSQIVHDCQFEYTVPQNDDGKNTPHIQKANIPMKNGGYLIYGTAHAHIGAIDVTLYGEDRRILYTSKPTYGNGTEPGNEKDYIVGMSGSYPELGSVKIKDGEVVTVEAKYDNKLHTGAMGHMSIYLADKLPGKV